MLITTNKTVKDWPEILAADEAMTTALRGVAMQTLRCQTVLADDGSPVPQASAGVHVVRLGRNRGLAAERSGAGAGRVDGVNPLTTLRRRRTLLSSGLEGGMIHRNRGSEPKFFGSERVAELRQRVRKFYAAPHESRRQRRFDFQDVARFFYPPLRDALVREFGSKCMYCETLVESVDIEAFRPKRGATNLDGTVDEDHYWWLALEWANYFPACRQCNTLKASRFPVAGKRASIDSTSAELKRERRLLLDPCEDTPETVLLFLDDGTVTSEDERGRVTIEVLGLNRETLLDARRADLMVLRKLLYNVRRRHRAVAAVDDLHSMIVPKSPFCAMRRQFIAAWATEVAASDPTTTPHLKPLLELKTALRNATPQSRREHERRARTEHVKRTKANEAYSVESEHVTPEYYKTAQLVERFELKNIRNFDELELRPSIGSEDGSSWCLLLGENGTGKSTVLQALAAALAGQAHLDKLGIKAADLLRRGESSGEVRVHLTGMSEPIVLTLTRSPDRMVVQPSEPKVMVLAYGATRLLPRRGDEQERISRLKIDNLFDPHALLSDGRPWLHTAPKPEFDRLARCLTALLPRSEGARFVREAGEVYVDSSSGRDTLEALSSGYQAVLALSLDIISVLRLGWPDMETAEGIVLVDEIDAHLHPRWKLRIVRRLREVFPRIQFIVTSHEPLTLRGLDQNEVVVLERTLEGGVRALTDLPCPKAMRVEQLLTSEFFGLHSTQDLEVDGQFEEYYRLLAKRRRGKKDEERLAELKRGLTDAGRMGVTPRERLVLQAADQYLAERRTTVAALDPSVKVAAQKRLTRLWSDIGGTSKRSTKR